MFDFFKSGAKRPPREGIWPDALGDESGPPAPRVRYVLDEDASLDALGVALMQRGVEAVEGEPGRWRSKLRAAAVAELPNGKGRALGLWGHRVGELAKGLRLEFGIPMRRLKDAFGSDASSLAPKGWWRVGTPANWLEICSAEEEQLQEARSAVSSRFPARRASGAATMARLELTIARRGVEEAAVCWENAGSAADWRL